MKSKTVFTKSLKEIDFQIQETIEKEFQPSLAIVFASLQFDLSTLSALFSNYDIAVIGASTAGEIGNKYIQTGGISLMLLDIKKDCFKIIQKEADYENSFQVGIEVAQVAKQHFSNPAFITVFSLTINGENFIDGISKEMDGFPPIFGGMAGDDLKMKSTYTFSNKNIGSNLATILVLDNDKIAVDGMALCGWKPIGIESTITKAKGNIIYHINNEPALTVMRRYFGVYSDNSPDDESIPLGAAQYPLQLLRKGNYVLRSIFGINEKNGSLWMAGQVEEGDQFQFSLAPGFEVIDQTIEGFQEYSTKHLEADVILMFSCVDRHTSLGPLIEDEVEGIFNVWKKPMIGFFSYGEIGQHGTGTSYFYNQTCSLVLLKERQQ